jgi:hypothetical protein
MPISEPIFKIVSTFSVDFSEANDVLFAHLVTWVI